MIYLFQETSTASTWGNEAHITASASPVMLGHGAQKMGSTPIVGERNMF